MIKSVGFIGYGKVGQSFAAVFGKHQAIDKVMVYVRDVNRHKENLNANMHKIFLTENICQVVQRSDLVVSAVWPQSALEVAKLAGKELKVSQWYLDLNTISETTTEMVNTIIGEAGATFVKGAIMGSINIYGAKVPMVLGGKKGKDLAEFFTQFGFVTENMGEDYQAPALLKALRSIFLKGITAVLAETVEASNRKGLTAAVLDSAINSLTYFEPKEVLLNWLADIKAHPQRRAEEMNECIELLVSLGVTPTMTSAAKQLFEFLSKGTGHEG